MKNEDVRSVRFGAREVVSKGLRYSFWGDLRHRSMKAPWLVFLSAIAAIFLLINCGFALLYMIGTAPIAQSKGTFLESLFFSIETYTTVGFGDLHPVTTYGHVIVSIEVFCGMLTTAMITALVFIRFTRIGPRILFAEVAPIATHDGRRSLMIRLANERMNEISIAHARVWSSTSYETKEGAPFRRFEELALLRDHSPIFALSWTLIHPIDPGSPLHGLDEAGAANINLTITVIIEGQDETTGQTVRARRTYDIADVRFGHRYVDILESSDDERTVLNYARFHLTQPDPDDVAPAPALAPATSGTTIHEDA